MQCSKHSFERAADLCEVCGEAMCVKCLVYPKGPRKGAFCISCALVVSGVKHGAISPLSKKELKRRRADFVGASPTPAVAPAPAAAVPATFGSRQIEWCA